MTNIQAEAEFHELFPGTYKRTGMDEIIEFRQRVIDTFPGEVEKLAPSTKLIKKGQWPWTKDNNAGKDLSEINEYYLIAILGLNIACDPSLVEYNEQVTKGIIQEIFERKPYLKDRYMGRSWGEMRDSLIYGWTPRLSVRLGSDNKFPIPGYYKGRDIKNVPEKYLISTLQSNCYCHPEHRLFDRQITEYIIAYMKKMMGENE